MAHLVAGKEQVGHIVVVLEGHPVALVVHPLGLGGVAEEDIDQQHQC